MEKPKISVVIPVYNMEKYLKRCMESVMNQSFRDLEIILVDDGSKDSSGKMCDEYQSIDSRVKVIHKQNGGLGFARNSGMEIASGEFISFVDSDDYIEPGMYEKLYARIKQENADTCIFGYHRVVGEKIAYTRTGALSGTFSGPGVFTNIFLNIIGSEPSCPEDFLILWQSSWLSLYSLDIIRKHNITFPSEREFISEDVLFNTDYYINSKCVTILNEPFYNYWLNENSLTKVYMNDRFARNVALYVEHLRRLNLYLPDEKAFNLAKERVQRIFLASARYCIMQIQASRGKKEALSLIAVICDDNTLQTVLNEYSWSKNPLKYRIFNYALKNKLNRFLYLLVSLKKGPNI